MLLVFAALENHSLALRHAVLNLSISNALGVKKQIRATRVQIRC